MNDIFHIKTEEDFRRHCLETFRYQYEQVDIYRKFTDYLRIRPDEIHTMEQIPFLPIEMFKNHFIMDRSFAPGPYFQSSGTTQTLRSKHYIADFKLYEESIYKSFSQFIGAPEDFIFLGLLPSYSENQHSSLIYMVDFLMKTSGKPENGYSLYNHTELLAVLETLKKQQKKVILFGVSFALLDFLEAVSSFSFPQLIVMETGGMKGRKEEITKDELLSILKNGFGTERIFSEYSMTELLSQAYSLENNEYRSPAWMKILIRDPEDPLRFLPEGRTGAVNIIDLANRHSCSFIATQDLGKSTGDTFQILGRMDHSDIRGCSLLVT
ncbi:MAG: acyl transferase [Chryseobacterium sp.]|nr:acyl transferase [Chryseobacterium sp.]